MFSGKKSCWQVFDDSPEETFQKWHQVSWGMLLVQTSQLDPSEHHIELTVENRWDKCYCVFEVQLPWSVCDCRHLQLNYAPELAIFVYLHKTLWDFPLRDFPNMKFCKRAATPKCKMTSCQEGHCHRCRPLL